jgi:hypothetical protein
VVKPTQRDSICVSSECSYPLAEPAFLLRTQREGSLDEIDALEGGDREGRDGKQSLAKDVGLARVAPLPLHHSTHSKDIIHERSSSRSEFH